MGLRFAHIREIPFIFNKIWSPNEILAGTDDVCHLLESMSSSCRFWYKGFSQIINKNLLYYLSQKDPRWMLTCQASTLRDSNSKETLPQTDFKMDKHHRCFMLGFCRPNVSILSQDQNKSLQIQWPSRVGYDIIIPDLYRNIAIQNVKFNKTPLYERNRLDNQRTEKINKIKHQERITENREANPELQIYIKPTTNVI